MSNPFGEDAVDFNVTRFLRSAYNNSVAMLQDDWMPYSASVAPVAWSQYVRDERSDELGDGNPDGDMGEAMDVAWPSLDAVVQQQKNADRLDDTRIRAPVTVYKRSEYEARMVEAGARQAEAMERMRAEMMHVLCSSIASPTDGADPPYSATGATMLQQNRLPPLLQVPRDRQRDVSHDVVRSLWA